MTDRPAEVHEQRILGTELLWAFGVGILVAATLSVVVFTALSRDINPPSNVERVDPKTLRAKLRRYGVEAGSPVPLYAGGALQN